MIRKLDHINFDSILITASDCDEPDPSTDARTILGFLVTEKILTNIIHTPNILVELLDPENEMTILKTSDDFTREELEANSIFEEIQLAGLTYRPCIIGINEMFNPVPGSIHPNRLC